MKDFKSLSTMILPQYQNSQAYMERFLVALHTEHEEINRKPNYEKIKIVDKSELSADMLTYFTENKDSFREEFTNELKDRLNDNDFKEFCDTISQEWFDGKRLRENGRSSRLKRSVYNYLLTITNNNAPIERFVQSNTISTTMEPLLSVESIDTILTVNDQMMYRHIEGWKKLHPYKDEISNDDIFLRRGIGLDNPLNVNKPYKEWDFINSYSIAFSPPEKFSQMIDGKIPAIINGDYTLFERRILFFSPFIPGMDVMQLEFGIIPSKAPLNICEQGFHSNIYEYIIDPTPFQK